MPLFGHKNKDQAAERTSMPASQNYDNTGASAGTGIGHHDGAGVGHHGGAHGVDRNDYGAGAGQQGVGQQGVGQHGGRDYGGQGMNNQQPQQGYGNNNSGIPPTGQLNSGSGHQGGGGAIAGKVEHAVGSMVGSQSLKARGLQKEQEANAFKQQSAEIEEAERLEQEALTRRERAVAHGAHPDNSQLGGGMAGNQRNGVL